MNAANYVLSSKDEVGEIFMFYLTRKEHERAIGYMLYASQLLDRYKNAIAMQLYNVQQSTLTVNDLIPDNLQPLKLTNEGEVFNLLVTEEKANKTLEAQEKTQPCVWRDDETLLLSSSYEQYQKSYDNGQITNLKFLKLIMEQMKAHEVDKTREQCINKMENLKKSYKKPKTLTISQEMEWTLVLIMKKNETCSHSSKN
ncbi:hypothetical protein PV328_004036 [Microctonus aethiopoides]|uniref:Myb/SANT-like DNA-binding domain-containing protein n=1 Tax=Microctonus aethiopoides TaxID=144406 RepID=A0AA39F9X5_9HYME|nr:hypothetical protein PV328_004036 [Microctonus aethiopoides]